MPGERTLPIPTDPEVPATKPETQPPATEVVTTAGIHAIVHNVKERTVVLKVAEGVMLEFDKPAVATVLKKDTAAPAESK